MRVNPHHVPLVILTGRVRLFCRVNVEPLKLSIATERGAGAVAPPSRIRRGAFPHPVSTGPPAFFPGVDAACDMRRVGQACILGGRHSHGGALTERAEEHDAPSRSPRRLSRNMPPGKRLSPIVG